jgi:hypothetical protein
MLVPFQGKNIEVNEVEIVTSNEIWNEYRLTDGKILRIKTVLITACKAISEKDPEGNPLYIVKTQQIVNVK